MDELTNISAITLPVVIIVIKVVLFVLFKPLKRLQEKKSNEKTDISCSLFCLIPSVSWCISNIASLLIVDCDFVMFENEGMSVGWILDSFKSVQNQRTTTHYNLNYKERKQTQREYN